MDLSGDIISLHLASFQFKTLFKTLGTHPNDSMVRSIISKLTNDINNKLYSSSIFFTSLFICSKQVSKTSSLSPHTNNHNIPSLSSPIIWFKNDFIINFLNHRKDIQILFKFYVVHKHQNHLRFDINKN